MRKIGIPHPSARRRTPQVNQCLILAAGNGSRLIKASGGSPKPLVQLHGKSLLEHVILGAHEAGIDRFVIVVGYGADAMRQWFAGRELGGVSVSVVDNFEYHKDNGVSVLKAKDQIRDPFLLLMADHIFEPRTARALLAEPLMPGEVILAVDPKLDIIFDLDDATKVRRDGDFILDIGKQIAKYDAFDTGMFLCSPALFDVLESVKKEGQLLIVRRHARAGTRRQVARVRYRGRCMAGCRHAGGVGLRREYLYGAVLPNTFRGEV